MTINKLEKLHESVMKEDSHNDSIIKSDMKQLLWDSLSGTISYTKTPEAKVYSRFWTLFKKYSSKINNLDSFVKTVGMISELIAEEATNKESIAKEDYLQPKFRKLGDMRFRFKNQHDNNKVYTTAGDEDWIFALSDKEKQKAMDLKVGKSMTVQGDMGEDDWKLTKVSED